MPTAPRLGRGEHSTPAAHVTKRALAGSVRSAASDPGNPGDGSSGSPGGRRRLLSRPHVDAVRLPGVLHHFVVDERHDVRADGGFENCRQVDAFVWNQRRVCGVNGDERSGRHLFLCYFYVMLSLTV